MITSITNKEGLTEVEWYDAACIGQTYGSKHYLDKNIVRKAWRAGEDPTEWAADFQKQIKMTDEIVDEIIAEEHFRKASHQTLNHKRL